MSDFVSEFWNLYVIVIVLVSVVGCWVFLLLQSKAKFTPGVPTGHVWDENPRGIQQPDAEMVELDVCPDGDFLPCVSCALSGPG